MSEDNVIGRLVLFEEMSLEDNYVVVECPQCKDMMGWHTMDGAFALPCKCGLLWKIVDGQPVGSLK